MIECVCNNDKIAFFWESTKNANMYNNLGPLHTMLNMHFLLTQVSRAYQPALEFIRMILDSFG